MNQIFFRNFLFDDRIIRNARISLENSMVAESLAPDTFTFVLEFSPDIPSPVPLKSNENDDLESNEGDLLYGLGDISTLGDLLPYNYGEEITVEHNEELLGKFYVQSIKQNTATQFEFTCTSLVGLLSTVTHYGGIYTKLVGGVPTPATFKEIVDEIFATAGVPNTAYDMEAELETLPLGNWLPIASCRDNLCQCCFPLGISILKNPDGSLHFTYNNSVDVTEISSDRIYLEGRSIDYQTPATKVTVIEHGFYESSVDQTVELYSDTTTVTSKLVTFEKPCYDLQCTGTLSIDVVGGVQQCGANYAIVSGAGTLTGKEYTHTTKEMSMSTGASGEPNEVSVTDAWMVDATNSYYTALRVSRYYGHVDEDSYAMTLKDGERNFTGQLVRFTDVKGDLKTGYIHTMDISLSSTLKSSSKIASGFALGPFGSNFIDSLVIWSGNGEGTLEDNMVSLNGLTGTFIPSDYGLANERVRVIVFSSSPGGSGGMDGTASVNNGQYEYPTIGYGGDAGTPGDELYYYAEDIDLTAASYSISLGAGGSAGAKNGGAGGALAHSSFGSYSSSSGIAAGSGGYYNPVTLHTYGGPGDEGARGGDGGGGLGYIGPGMGRDFESFDGESITFNGVTYSGGGHGASYTGGAGWPGISVGGGGGGAAVGANGGDGTDSTGFYSVALGAGGIGASVPNTSYPKQAILGKGGAAGHGGGGGGIPGNTSIYNSALGDDITYCGTVGAGGSSSPGGKGADGFIVILTPIAI